MEPTERIPYPWSERVRSFEKEYFEFIVRQLGKLTTSLIPPENINRFYHGRRWSSPTIDTLSDEGEFQLKSIEASVHCEAVKQNDYSAFSNFVTSILASFQKQHGTDISEVAMKSVKRSGNIVSLKDHPSIAHAWMELLKNSDARVDRQGKVSFIQPFSPQMLSQLHEDLGKHPEEFHRELLGIYQQKASEALAREQTRLLNYKGREV